MNKFTTAHLFLGASYHGSITRWALLAFLMSSTPVFAQTTVWTDGTGNWFTPANWSAGVPNSSPIADINNGGTAQITSSGAMGHYFHKFLRRFGGAKQATV